MLGVALLLTIVVIVAAIVGGVLLVVKSVSRRAITQASSSMVSGWYPDQADPSLVRWFDGREWTDQTQARLH
ncbi:DUF2510 domain-containing protein [Nocardia sp. NPDC051756]|uniref:DUF2510 domain-containing protein n=1 Tax=Nocardia sp. NPDC051756 TaxID=3154751 RepID=UPI00342D0EAC